MSSVLTLDRHSRHTWTRSILKRMQHVRTHKDTCREMHARDRRGRRQRCGCCCSMGNISACVIQQARLRYFLFVRTHILLLYLLGAFIYGDKSVRGGPATQEKKRKTEEERDTSGREEESFLRSLFYQEKSLFLLPRLL